MPKSIAIFLNNDYMIYSSKRNAAGIKVTQKPIWRSDYPQILVRVLRRLNIKCVQAVINLKKNEKYDIAIIIDSEVTASLIDYISRNPIAKRQYIYFVNQVTDKTKYIIEKANDADIVLATYSLSDSKLYGIEYHNQVWNVDWVPSPAKTIDYDMVFLGGDKGRYSEIVKLIKYAESNKLRTNFMIYSKKEKPYTIQHRVPYSEYIDIANRSKAIIDIVNENNYGLTYRPLEAIFMKKKLITNYKEIREYDFYKSYKENVFILGIDDLNKLTEFLQKPVLEREYPMDNYDICGWLRGFK